jgi:hypothetical protein
LLNALGFDDPLERLVVGVFSLVRHTLNPVGC